MSVEDADEQRAQMRDAWEQVAPGWGRRADETRAFGMPVSSAMVESLRLQPGERVLELAAGPGDTGFLAAELVQPGGTLICSDAAEGMLDVARERAERFGVTGVEFKRLELEWIDLETASVDAALCRWGVMLSLDPEAAMREIRRVVRPRGRVSIAVWDRAEVNPWATLITDALVKLGALEPPDRSAPASMFSLADPERLVELLEAAGFLEASVEPVDVVRVLPSVDAFLEQTRDIQISVIRVLDGLSAEEQSDFKQAFAAAASQFVDDSGALTLPGCSLVAAAEA